MRADPQAAAARTPASRTPGGGRRPRQQKEGEHVEVLDTTPLPTDADEPTVRLEVPTEGQNAVVADATVSDDEDHDARAEAEAPKAKYAMVTKGGYFLDKQGTRALMREGKEISSTEYDFGKLQRHGIKLRVLKDEERGQFVEG